MPKASRTPCAHNQKLRELSASSTSRSAAKRKNFLGFARVIRAQLTPVMKLREVAAVVGVSASRVEQIELEALAKIARAFLTDRITDSLNISL